MTNDPDLLRLDGLAETVARAQRGDLELGDVSLAQLSRQLRERVVDTKDEVDLLWAAESLQLLTRLLELKMGRRLDDLSEESLSQAEPQVEELDPGARLEEYRMFKAAAGVLLGDSNAGPRAFLRVLGLPVEPRQSLRLSPEQLAIAFSELLARLPDPDEVSLTLPSYTVEEKVVELRELLRERGTLHFNEVFASARDRMEAVALFLALLELVWSGEADCDQEMAGGPIVVERAGGG
ncbi:MAG: segregation and condensation protein A [Candidatus Dormibacteria bacterium]